MFFKMVLVTFACFLFLIFINNVSSHAKIKVNVTAATNISTRTVKVGEPFTLRCELRDYKIEKFNSLYMYFYYKTNGRFAYYVIPALTATNQHATFHKALAGMDNVYFGLVLPLENSTAFPVFEISITPRIAFKTEFYCSAVYNNAHNYSNYIPMTAAGGPSLWTATPPPHPHATTVSPPPSLSPPSPPQLVLTSNVSHIQTNRPFAVTCSVAKFNAVGKRYLINYYNSRDGLLASYEVDGSGKSLFSAGEYSNFSAHHGPKAAFPLFELVVNEKVDDKLNYWCELVVGDGTKKYQSPRWNLPLGVKFSSSLTPFSNSNAATNQTTTTPSPHTVSDRLVRGKCTVEGFDQQQSTLEYRVEYYSDLGATTGESLLAYYWIKPNTLPEFVHRLHLPPWSSISHGSNVAYPHFEIVSQVSGNSTLFRNHKWWCALRTASIAATNSSTSLIKSNMQLLFT